MAFWHEWSEEAGIKHGCIVTNVVHSDDEHGVWVVDTQSFGRVLLADTMMLRSAQAYSPYHEMLAHMPLNTAAKPRSILLLGGADGAVLELLLSYYSIEAITIAGFDATIANAASACFPSLKKALADPRLTVSELGAAAFIRDCRTRFDAILVDQAQPLSSHAFPQSLFCDCFRLLTGDGVLVCDCGALAPEHALRETAGILGKLRRLFPVFRPYCAPSRSSMESMRLFGFAAKTFDPATSLPTGRAAQEGAQACWYNEATHRAAFALPAAVESALHVV